MYKESENYTIPDYIHTETLLRKYYIYGIKNDIKIHQAFQVVRLTNHTNNSDELERKQVSINKPSHVVHVC